jgi:hypothetical protein
MIIDRIRHARRLAVVAAALIAITAGVQPNHADGIVSLWSSEIGSTGPAGASALLRLRIPFGGAPATTRQPTISLSFGSSWRDAPGSPYLANYHFVPGAEFGVTLRGDPVLRFGSFDLRNLAAEAEGETFCGRNKGLCIVGGIAIAAGLIYWLADEKNTHSCEYAAGCPT